MSPQYFQQGGQRVKKLDINWDGIVDSTGYLFSLAKSLACAVKNSPWPEYAEDIVATSGFAFRMWVSSDLCPSATSIWAFDSQKPWVENGGLICGYVGRYWDQEALEAERRLQAIDLIKKSIDRGVPAVAWDIGVPEWGLVTGYDDEREVLFTLSITGEGGEMPYGSLGKREIPILSVLTVVGRSEKPPQAILEGTMRLALQHLRGQEWSSANANGLAAYPALIRHFGDDFNPELSWNMEYFLGTFGALKYYAWKYFEKMAQAELAEIYKTVYEAWLNASVLKTSEDLSKQETRQKIASLLEEAYEKEKQAVEIMGSTVQEG